MVSLSKSRLIEYRQCPKRMWLRIHRPELAIEDPGARHRMAIGNEVGELARGIYDPAGVGRLFDAQRDGYEPVFQSSLEALGDRRPLFEAGYRTGSIFAFVDVLLPDESGRGWRLVEVKSSGSVKGYQRDDLAIQVEILTRAGVLLTSVAVACIDSSWTYHGESDYRGLLKTMELLDEATSRGAEVREWESGAVAVAVLDQPPEIRMGSQCEEPFECPFAAHCRSESPPVEVQAPVAWLPDVRRHSLKAHLKRSDVGSMRDVPDDLLTETQRHVKAATLSRMAWTNPDAARKALATLQWPLHFLDFEAAQMPIPRWPGCRPFEQIPFQYSLHTLFENGRLELAEFLDLTGEDPRRAIAEQLVKDFAGTSGSVVAYHMSFEGKVIERLASQFPDLAAPLNGIRRRLKDLLPMTRAAYYHPAQRGSWSIKAVLPTIAGAGNYDDLDGVANGEEAALAYFEATSPGTSQSRGEEIDENLRRYCRLDTVAMVRLLDHLKRIAESTDC